MKPESFNVLTAYASGSIRMVALALAYDAVGALEEGGANRGAIVRAVMGGREGLPWCAAFATECYRLAARMLRKANPLSDLRNRLSSSAIFRWAKRRGKLTRRPRNGDLFLLPGGPTGYKHTGIVRKVKGDRVFTIEGNLSDQVKLHQRKRKRLVFVRVTD